MSAIAVSWDQWRASYDEWGFAEQQDFYDQVFDVARVQRQHDGDRLAAFLDSLPLGRPFFTVTELGGWDGELAAEMLGRYANVHRWTNYEISRKAVEASVCADTRYEPVALDDWYWSQTYETDVFVASHVLEHLRFADVCRVLDATDAWWLYLQVPVGEGPRTWDGYHGSHILEVGWRDLQAELDRRGYDCIPGLSNVGIRCFERRL